MAEDRSRVARELLATARKMRVAPTLWLGMRVPTTHYVYDDPDHPDRVTQTVASPDWTDEDRALLVALNRAEAERNADHCPGGDHLIAEAWHSDTDGFWDPGARMVCLACTAQQGKQVVYQLPPTSTYPQGQELPPFDLSSTVVRPDKDD